MHLTFRDADFDALADLWNEFYPPMFRIDSALLKQNTVDSPVFDWGASCIDVMDDEVLGFLAVKQPATKLYKSGDKDTSHLSAIAFRSPDSGIDLLSRAKRTLIHRGQNRLVFGMDSRHFFPGCPNDATNLCSILMVEGFEEGGECFDVERDLSNYESPVPISGKFEFRPLQKTEREVLEKLIRLEFSPRWAFDTLTKFDAEGPECVVGAFDKGEIVGFTLIQESKQKLPISGATWKDSLGQDWGALGPIGVAESRRKEGIGHALLASALLELKARKVMGCIIDWTVLGDFYGRHGFEITRRYRAKLLKLGD